MNGNFGEFSVLQYSLRANDGAVRLSHGSGRKYGPDPQSLLISTGQQLEPCPCWLPKNGIYFICDFIKFCRFSRESGPN
jgi:hypothetical protein